jgi:ATP-binding cassette subfamily B protein
MPAIVDPVSPVSDLRAGGSIEFREVSYSHPGAQDPVLRDVSFAVHPGETFAIVGGTGCGKSTLLTLAVRLHDASAGRVIVDGQDVRDMDRRELWSRIGYVPQRAFLFTGTVGSNLRLGDHTASDDTLWRALRIAQAQGFVSEMPSRLAATVAQGGADLSGGQRQRLAIARALLKRPEILLLDDGLSALDSGTEGRLWVALRRAFPTTTVLVVTQRVSTLQLADRIAVLDAGRLVGIGTHAELITTNETYRGIIEPQLDGQMVA